MLLIDYNKVFLFYKIIKLIYELLFITKLNNFI